MVEIAVALAVLVFVGIALLLVRAARQRWAAYVEQRDAAMMGDAAQVGTPGDARSS